MHNNNEIQEMRNSMKLNFVNHLRASKKPMPQTFQLHTQIKSDLRDPPQFTFKMKDKTLDWNKVNKMQGDRLSVDSKLV